MSVTTDKAVCPKCGAEMRLADETEWQLDERYSVSFICPNCLHVKRVDSICLREDDR